jgi:PEP-CTERM motif-containing protein
MARSLRIVVLLALLYLVVPAAWADTLDVVSQYNVDGLLTITGNNACPPLPACAETIGFSFVVDVVFVPTFNAGPYEAYIVPGSDSVESLGPLGKFTSGGGFPGDITFFACGDCNYLGFGDPGGDEIDIHLAQGAGISPFVPSVDHADLYRCGTVTCVTDLCPPSFCGPGTTSAIGIFSPGEVEATVTEVPVPEPQTLALLLIGLAWVLVFQFWRRSHYASA